MRMQWEHHVLTHFIIFMLQDLSDQDSFQQKDPVAFTNPGFSNGGVEMLEKESDITTKDWHR